MEKYEVIIIGGGASGLMCALNTTQKTLLIEAGERVGKKILATGNGKCNLTNDVIEPRFYNTPLVESYFRQFDQKQTLQFFAGLGLQTYADEEGRRYPLSNSANSVLDLMVRALENQRNVRVLVQTKPTAVTKNGAEFTVQTPGQIYVCKKLILATGGNSGTNYLQQLGVKFLPFRPSLVSLKTTKNKGLAGVRVSRARVRCQGFDEIGEVLFKEDGLSGIVIFNLSAHLARCNVNNATVEIDLLSAVSEKDLLAWLQDSVQRHPDYDLVTMLSGVLHKSLAKNLLERLGLAQKTAREIKAGDVSNLVQLIKHDTFVMRGYSDNYQVQTGGVDLADLDGQLQSRQVPGLYVCGELVNVDGVCGGYNLQWAWTSGKIVAREEPRQL